MNSANNFSEGTNLCDQHWAWKINCICHLMVPSKNSPKFEFALYQISPNRAKIGLPWKPRPSLDCQPITYFIAERDDARSQLSSTGQIMLAPITATDQIYRIGIHPPKFNTPDRNCTFKICRWHSNMLAHHWSTIFWSIIRLLHGLMIVPTLYVKPLLSRNNPLPGLGFEIWKLPYDLQNLHCQI
jgi:hypothetical protein